MKKYAKLLNILTIVLAALLIFTVCSSASPADGSDGSVFSGNSDIAAKGPKAFTSDDSVRSAVNFDHELDSYENHYGASRLSGAGEERQESSRETGPLYRETKEKGITQENWLDYLDNLTDSEITAMLNREPLRGSFQ